MYRHGKDTEIMKILWSDTLLPTCVIVMHYQHDLHLLLIDTPSQLTNHELYLLLVHLSFPHKTAPLPNLLSLIDIILVKLAITKILIKRLAIISKKKH